MPGTQGCECGVCEDECHHPMISRECLKWVCVAPVKTLDLTVEYVFQLKAYI